MELDMVVMARLQTLQSSLDILYDDEMYYCQALDRVEMGIRQVQDDIATLYRLFPENIPLLT